MTVNADLGNFKYFVYEFNRNGENKTVFTWVDYQGFMAIITVDWIQKGNTKVDNRYATLFYGIRVHEIIKHR